MQGTRASVLGLMLAMSLSACGQQNTSRENIANEDEAATQAKYRDLAPAEGRYSGQVTLSGSNQVFDAVLEAHRAMENVRSSESTDPTATISLPRLSGDVRFPAIDNLQPEDYPGFHALLDPLGGYATALFGFGNYDPKSTQLVLPYTVPGYSSGSFGEFTGTLLDGHFKGTWFCNAIGTVGTFDLAKEAP